jgi:hypothetical protein
VVVDGVVQDAIPNNKQTKKKDVMAIFIFLQIPKVLALFVQQIIMEAGDCQYPKLSIV